MNYFTKNLKLLSKNKNVKLDLWNDIINGKTNPTIENLVEISTFFQLSIDHLIKNDLEEIICRQKKIKMLILDIDGVMTDGGMYFTENGDEIKKFNTKDGLAIMELVKKGIKLGIISSGFRDKIIKRRAERLGINYVYVGREPKIDIMTKWLKELNLKKENIAYIGDDLNDIEIMQAVGTSACPSNAVNKIKQIADIVLKKEGGEGCVREFIDNHISV